MAQKSPILTEIGRFPTVTPVWIHWWLWNDAQSLTYFRWGTLLILNVIRQISGSHDTKKSPILTRIGRSWTDTLFEFIDSFEMMHKAWCSIEELLYCFSVIHQISRSHRLKNRKFDINLSKITKPITASKSIKFAMFKYNFQNRYTVHSRYLVVYIFFKELQKTPYHSPIRTKHGSSF